MIIILDLQKLCGKLCCNNNFDKLTIFNLVNNRSIKNLKNY